MPRDVSALTARTVPGSGAVSPRYPKLPVVVAPTKGRDSRRLVRDPVYFQLCDLLRGLIRSGEFKAGQQFLTEREVGARFAISRVTANKALSHLVVEGLLEFRKGVGTFVRGGALDYDLHSLVSFTRRASLAGTAPSTRLLSFTSCKASQAGSSVASELEVGPDEPLIYMERLRLADAVPVILERRYLIARHCPQLRRTQLQGSLYTLLTEHFKLRLGGATQVIRALNLSGADARQLVAKPGAASLWVHGVGHLDEGGPIWVEDTLYRGDRYEFLNRIGTLGVACPARPSSGGVPSTVMTPPR